MDTTNLLRAYHRALNEARSRNDLTHRTAAFIERHKMSPPFPVGIWMIRDAHVARVSGQGSPAACDAALNEALRAKP